MTIEQIRIKERRKALKLTQKDVANMLGISQPAYQQIENGRTTDMRISTLKKLCEVLKTTPNFLLNIDSQE